MKARVAVVGTGWWATEAHLPSLVAMPDATIAGLVDPDPARRARAAGRCGDPPGYATLDELLAAGGIDGVVIATPHGTHHALAAAALDAGLHVLLEKPMTIEPADAHDLARRAQAAGVELIVGYPYHFNAQARALREAIAGGAIGEIEHVACLFASVVRELYRGRPEAYAEALDYAVQAPMASTYSRAGGGQGQTQVTHLAALLLWLTGLVPTSISAFTASAGLAVDLADAVAIQFAGGAVGTLGSTGGVASRQAELLEYRIFGRDGDVLFEPNEGIARIRRADGSIDALVAPAPDQRYPQHAPAANLVDVILGRGANGSPAAIGVATVELVDALYRSAAAGGVPVTLT